MLAAEAGWRLKQMRKLLGISKEALARECGTNKRTIRNVERGRQMMSAELLARACTALGVSADYVLGLVD